LLFTIYYLQFIIYYYPYGQPSAFLK